MKYVKITPVLFKQSQSERQLHLMVILEQGKINAKILLFNFFWQIRQKPHYPSSQQSCNLWSTFFVNNTTQEHRSALKPYTQSKDPNTLTIRE